MLNHTRAARGTNTKPKQGTFTESTSLLDARTRSQKKSGSDYRQQIILHRNKRGEVTRQCNKALPASINEKEALQHKCLLQVDRTIDAVKEDRVIRNSRNQQLSIIICTGSMSEVVELCLPVDKTANSQTQSTGLIYGSLACWIQLKAEPGFSLLPLGLRHQAGKEETHVVTGFPRDAAANSAPLGFSQVQSRT